MKFSDGEAVIVVAYKLFISSITKKPKGIVWLLESMKSKDRFSYAGNTGREKTHTQDL